MSSYIYAVLIVLCLLFSLGSAEGKDESLPGKVTKVYQPIPKGVCQNWYAIIQQGVRTKIVKVDWKFVQILQNYKTLGVDVKITMLRGLDYSPCDGSDEMVSKIAPVEGKIEIIDNKLPR